MDAEKYGWKTAEIELTFFNTKNKGHNIESCEGQWKVLLVTPPGGGVDR